MDHNQINKDLNQASKHLWQDYTRLPSASIKMLALHTGKGTLYSQSIDIIEQIHITDLSIGGESHGYPGNLQPRVASSEPGNAPRSEPSSSGD